MGQFRFVPGLCQRNSNPPPPNPCPGTLGHTDHAAFSWFRLKLPWTMSTEQNSPVSAIRVLPMCASLIMNWPLLASTYLVRQVYTGYSISVFTLQTKILVLGLITWVGLEINSWNDHGLGFTQLSSVFGGLVRGVLILLSCCSLTQSMWACPTVSFPLAG